ncbi:MAG: B12-binding domain-containing radical SAM protein [Petrotogales bacterium]
MKKILLVNPWIEDVSAYDFWLKPVGLLYISSALKKLGFEPRLIDLLDRHDQDLNDYLKKPLKDKYYGTGNFYHENINKPDCLRSIPRYFKRYGIPEKLFKKKLRFHSDVEAVFVTSMMTYWHYGVSDTIRVIKEELGEKPVILGGVYATLLNEYARKNSGANFVADGTGMLPLKKAFDYLGVEGKMDNLFANWLEILEPDYSHYRKLPYKVIITSAGCPFRCSYCASWRLWNRFIYQSPKKTMNVVEHFIDSGTENIVFFDDALLVGDRFKTFLKMYLEEKKTVQFHLPNGIHARYIDEELAILMKKANFKTIKLGYETYNPDLQKETGGKVSNIDLEKAVINLKVAGFGPTEVSAYIIANLPGQSIKDTEFAIDKCKELGIIPSVNEFTPIPKTPQWEELVKEGKLNKNVDPLLLNNSILPYWWDGVLNVDQINELKIKALKVKEQLLNA